MQQTTQSTCNTTPALGPAVTTEAPVTHDIISQYKLLLTVGYLHNQHSSTPWSQAKFSTVHRENRPLFHTWVVREWPTFPDGTDGRWKSLSHGSILFALFIVLVYLPPPPEMP